MWIVILLFVLVFYLNSLRLERNTVDVDEVFIAFKCLFIKEYLCLYSESVMFILNYINVEV